VYGVIQTVVLKAKRVGKVARLRGVPPIRRLELLRVDFPLSLRARLGGGEVLSLRMRRGPRGRGGKIYFGRESFAVDRVAFLGIFLEGWYGADYHDADVLDIGGHKGYYGAFALLGGARRVVSFEPEERNYALLERAAESFRAAGFDWRVVRAAIGESDGEVDLRVSEEAASHSLYTSDSPAAPAQRVRMMRMEAVLDEVAAGARIIVKIDAEGAECAAILASTGESWSPVDELFVETHAFAPCSSVEIIERASDLGLRLQSRETEPAAELLHFRRAQEDVLAEDRAVSTASE
jgi:FkbM family methyltransferase